MNTQELLDIVTESESIIVTIELSQVGVVKRRLSNMRSRQQVALEDFADPRRLEYKILPKDNTTEEGYVKLRISLVKNGKKILGIKDIKPAREF